MPCRPGFLLVALCGAHLAGCLDITNVPQRGDASMPSSTDGGNADGSAPPSSKAITKQCLSLSPDPLLGAWHKRGAPESACEFFSNGRYTDECGLIDGDPFEWDQLDDGRYFFNATNSFGSIVTTCKATPTYASGCGELTLKVDCGEGPHSLKLVADDT